MNKNIFFEDPEFSFQALRTVSAAVANGADIGECWVAITKIQAEDTESWYDSWVKLARKLENKAAVSKEEGHEISYRDQMFRASNYYRTAEFFLHGIQEDPRMMPTWKKSESCFVEGIKKIEWAEIIKIPFENSFLPGYFFRADSEKGKLLIVQTGFDGTKEELFFQTAQEAVKRGYHCLVFEGPGQGQVIREQKIPFRPDWETVITPVVNFAITLDLVDPKRIALMGISMGGYLVPRALAFEKRIKIGIANGGIIDFHSVCMQAGPVGMEKLLDDPEACKEIDKEIASQMKKSAALRWAVGNGMFTFRASSPSEWLRMTRAYQLQNLIKDISCMMLVVDSDADFQMHDQSKKFYEALQCPKDYLLFESSEGAGAHCQIGAYKLSNEKIFNWLDQKL